MTFEQLLDQQRPHIERVVRDLARKNYLSAAEIEEYRGAVERALERNDYELLRAFEGRSTWETYLSTVVTRQFYLFQATMWGKWRPTQTAIRLGAPAMLLEELVVRDRFAVNDAIEWMRNTHRVDLPRHRLLQLAAQLGISSGRGVRGSEPAAAPNAELCDGLRDALALVSADDRLILELRFRDGLPLTRIAALMRLEARSLQRRIELAKNVIRESLLVQGINASDLETLLRREDADVADVDRQWWEEALARPSKGSAI